jgi:hypothetical protein
MVLQPASGLNSLNGLPVPNLENSLFLFAAINPHFMFSHQAFSAFHTDFIMFNSQLQRFQDEGRINSQEQNHSCLDVTERSFFLEQEAYSNYYIVFNFWNCVRLKKGKMLNSICIVG